MINNGSREMFTAQVCIARSGFDLKHRSVLASMNFKQCHVEGSTAHIVHEHVLATCDILVQSVCDRGGRWLVDNAQYVQPCNFTCVLRCLSLCIVEVGGNRYHCIVHWVAK